MPDFYDFNSTFFLSLATMSFGFFGLALGYALKSKCSSVKLCGCIEIVRDIEAELQEDMIAGVPALQAPHHEPAPPTPPIFSRRNSPVPPTTVSSRRESLLQSRLANAMLSFSDSMKTEGETKT